MFDFDLDLPEVNDFGLLDDCVHRCQTPSGEGLFVEAETHVKKSSVTCLTSRFERTGQIRKTSFG